MPTPIPEDNLKLQPGEPLQLQTLAEDGSVRYHVRVIGYVVRKSLLVTAPLVEGRIARVREGQVYAVRMMIGNRVIGFTTRVIKTHMHPYPYMHLSFPEDIQSIVVRGAPRIKVNMPVEVQRLRAGEALSLSSPASMVDLSAQGCQLSAPTKIADVGMDVQISAHFEVGGIRRDAVLKGRIRNLNIVEAVQEGEQRVYLQGVKFMDVDDDANILLHAYLYEHVAELVTF